MLKQHPECGLQTAMRMYAPLVKAIVQQILPNQSQDVEECVADTFVALWRHSAELCAEERPLKGWLIITARNKALDRYRVKNRHAAVSMTEDVLTWFHYNQDTQRTSDAEERLQTLVLAMPAPDKEIFLRKYYGLQSSKEIAIALDKTENFVNTRLSRGRRKLRTAYLQAEETERSNV